jgi:hypothetical protein
MMMKRSGYLLMALILVSAAPLQGQQRRDLPDVSPTFKGMLNLPVMLGNPLFQGVTETVGQVDGAFQVPVFRGWGLGVGGKMTWFALDERALAPDIRSGEVRRATYYGKVSYEEYTGPRTFFELSGRVGGSIFAYDCATCRSDRPNVFHWGIGTSYYVHVSDNLAFGFNLGYERDDHRFSSMDLGLESFSGRREISDNRAFQVLVIGMGFSTRFRRTQEGPAW